MKWGSNFSWIYIALIQPIDWWLNPWVNYHPCVINQDFDVLMLLSVLCVLSSSYEAPCCSPEKRHSCPYYCLIVCKQRVWSARTWQCINLSLSVCLCLSLSSSLYLSLVLCLFMSLLFDFVSLTLTPLWFLTLYCCHTFYLLFSSYSSFILQLSLFVFLPPMACLTLSFSLSTSLFF